MKKTIKQTIYFIILLALTFSTNAQEVTAPKKTDQQPFAKDHLSVNRNNPENRKNIEAIKVAYITRALNLTIEEAQKFWPVHNNYVAEIKNARKENTDNEIAFEEKLLSIRKKYNADFKKILNSDERANLVFKSEKGFNHMLGRELMGRKLKMEEGRKLMDDRRKMIDGKRMMMEQRRSKILEQKKLQQDADQ